MVVNRVLNKTNISKLFLKQSYTRSFPLWKYSPCNSEKNSTSSLPGETNNKQSSEFRTSPFVYERTNWGEKFAQGKLWLIVFTWLVENKTP